MVAGYHYRLDSRADRVGNSLLAFLARRIYHRYKSEENIIVLGFYAERFVRNLIRKGKNAESCFGVIIILF